MLKQYTIFNCERLPVSGTLEEVWRAFAYPTDEELIHPEDPDTAWVWTPWGETTWRRS